MVKNTLSRFSILVESALSAKVEIRTLSETGFFPSSSFLHAVRMQSVKKKYVKYF